MSAEEREPLPRVSLRTASGPGRVRGVGERGSAAVLATVLIGVLAVVTMLVAVVGGAVTDQRRVESAAALGALAGASAAQRGQDGCAAAGAMVVENRARVTSCSELAGIVTLSAGRATRPVLGVRFTVTSRARAGPAGSLTPP
jgi:secretion/DNA translocation related TadE-like protein